MAPFRAHQEQVRHVAAGDQQHDADGGQQNPENLVRRRGSRRSASGRTFGRNSNRANTGGRSEIMPRHIGVRLGERDARLQPRERLKPEADAARRVHVQRHRQHDRRARCAGT